MRIFFIFLFLFSFPHLIFAEDGVLYSLDGKEISYQEIITSQKTVLFLWTSWCVICKREFINLKENFLSYDNVDFFYINLGERKSTVKKFAESLNLKESVTGKILLDPNHILDRKFFIIGVPTFIFLKEGIPIYRSYSIDKEILKEVFRDE